MLDKIEDKAETNYHTNHLNPEYCRTQERTVVRAPSNREIAEKINEIIDFLNKWESEVNSNGNNG